jgi:hypothetical protein
VVADIFSKDGMKGAKIVPGGNEKRPEQNTPAVLRPGFCHVLSSWGCDQ